MLSKLFTVLGLTDKDEKIYTIALELGNHQPASILAHKAGLKRVDTYNHLATLCKKGICMERKRKGIKNFKACPPDKLLNMVEDKKSLIQEAQSQLHTFLPKVLSKSKKKLQDISINFYKGEDDVIELLERFHKCKNRRLRFYGSTINIAGVKIGANNIDYYIKNRIKRSIQLKQIVPDNEYSRGLRAGDGNGLRETKYLPAGSDPKANLLMYDDEVVIIINDESFTAILVKSPEVAEMFEGLFDTLWGNL